MFVFPSPYACVCVHTCLFCERVCNVCVCLEGLSVGLVCPRKREGSVCYVLGGLVSMPDIWYACRSKGAEDVNVFTYFCMYVYNKRLMV